MSYEIFFDETPALAVISPIISMKENTAGTLTFSLPPTHHYHGLIRLHRTKISIYFDDDTEPRYIFFPYFKETSIEGVESYECSGDLAVLKESVVSQTSNSGLAVRQLLEKYISIHNNQAAESKQLQVGVVTVEGIMRSYGNYRSVWDEITDDLIGRFGGIIRTRHEGGITYVDYLAQPEQIAQEVVLGTNLLNLISEFDASEIASACLPIGKAFDDESRTENAVAGIDEHLTISSVNGGVEYVVNDTLRERFGFIIRAVEFSEVEDAETLKRCGEEWLTAQITDASITATAMDLNIACSCFQRFVVGNTVNVKANPLGIDTKLTITELELNLLEPEKSTVTLGSTQAGLSDVISSEAEKVDAYEATLKQLTVVDNNGTTEIDGGKIKTGTIEAESIKAGTLKGVNLEGERLEINSKAFEADESDEAVPDSASIVVDYNYGGEEPTVEIRAVTGGAIGHETETIVRVGEGVVTFSADGGLWANDEKVVTEESLYKTIKNTIFKTATVEFETGVTIASGACKRYDLPTIAGTILSVQPLFGGSGFDKLGVTVRNDFKYIYFSNHATASTGSVKISARITYIAQ